MQNDSFFIKLHSVCHLIYFTRYYLLQIFSNCIIWYYFSHLICIYTSKGSNSLFLKYISNLKTWSKYVQNKTCVCLSVSDVKNDALAFHLFQLSKQSFILCKNFDVRIWLHYPLVLLLFFFLTFSWHLNEEKKIRYDKSNQIFLDILMDHYIIIRLI